MFREIYYALLDDLRKGNKNTPIFKHHIDYVNRANRFNGWDYAANSGEHDIVTDFIASMTDDYFIDLYEYLFNKKAPIEYISYFNNV